MNSIPAQPHTFVEIGHEIFSTVDHSHPSADSRVTRESMFMEYWSTIYSKLAQEKYGRLTELLT